MIIAQRIGPSSSARGRYIVLCDIAIA